MRTLSQYDANPDKAMALALADASCSVVAIDAPVSFARRVVLTRPLDIIGESLSTARLSWMTTGDAGIYVTRAAAGSRLDTLYCAAPSAYVGADIGLAIGGNGIKGRDLFFDNWSGQGVRLRGDTQGENANAVQLSNVVVRMCGHGGAKAGQPNEQGAGVYCVGGDANGGAMIGVRAYDCRKGIVDASFLGNQWIGCSAEGCNNRFDKDVTAPYGVGFATSDGNCVAGFIGCYTESDSVGRVLYPAQIVGGIFENHGTAVQIGGTGARGFFETAGPDGVKVKIGALPHTALSIEDVGDISSAHRLRRIGGWWGLNYAGLDQADALRFSKTTPWLPQDTLFGYYGTRVRWLKGIADVSYPCTDGATWKVGDRVAIAAPAPGEPSEYVLTAAGWKVSGRVDA